MLRANGGRWPALPLLVGFSLTAGDVRVDWRLWGSRYATRQSLFNAHTPPKYLKALRSGDPPAATAPALARLLGPRTDCGSAWQHGVGVGALPGTPARPGAAAGRELTWRSGRLAASAGADGEGGAQAPVLLPAPWYVNKAPPVRWDPVVLDLPPRVLRRPLNSPAIPPNASEMADHCPWRCPRARRRSACAAHMVGPLCAAYRAAFALRK